MVVKTRNAIDDRRAANRFPIERQVHYKTIGKRKIGESGFGQTINISSTGVLFTTDQLLGLGRRLEVAISWPAQLDASVGLQLVAQGRIVRSEPGTAAIEIQHYEFRTCAKKGNTSIGARRFATAAHEQFSFPAATA
jgi:hypothetical protein